MDKKIKVLIVEDHALTRIGLKTALEESSMLEVIGEAEYGETGVTLTKELEPDLVLMDLGLPNMNGIEATKIIKEHNNNIKIVILTSHDTDNEVVGAIGAGADSYCLKDINPKRLVSIIENVAQGGVWLDPAIAKTVLTKVILAKPQEQSNIPDKKIDHSPLTEREVEILQLLANGLNNIEIAQELFVSQHTVKSHICNVLQKLSVDDRTQAVARAMRKGWIT